MGEKIKKLSLKWKLFFYLICFCAILLGILWLFQTVMLDYFYRSIKSVEIKSSADTLSRNIDRQDLSYLLEDIAKEGELSIRIVSEDASVLYAEDFNSSSVFRKMSPQDFLAIISAANANGGIYDVKNAFSYLDTRIEPAQGKDFDRREPSPIPGQSFTYAKITKTAEGKTVAIILNAMISPVNATVTTLRYQLYVVTAIMLILSVILALFMAKRVSKPIEEINKSAKLLATGNYDTQFCGKGFLEINELSETLNTTANELLKVESLRRELLANISHDLRTPISLIYSYAEVMHDFPDEITPKQTQIIMDEADRLSRLVNDILDISKLESGNQELNLTVYNLTESISATTNRVAELIKQEGYKLSFNYAREVEVCADETKITQVIYNLLINAINYTGSDKTITIKQLIIDDYVRIEVSDSGEGISPDDLPHIWDRYYKVDKNHRRAITGTGLGLSIVKKVISLHQGKYGVESQVGMGSTFWFSLKFKNMF